ncbi:MAG: CBS domain-containing protein [bacterium]|nr:CBS domain-containing protein [bacterium]
MELSNKYSKIIISHPGTDFDSLASMWAAHLLYPDTPVVMITGMDSNVREFLNLYGHELSRLKLKEIDISAIEHIVIVDCSSRTQLGRIEGLLDREKVYTEVWDHHRPEGPEFKVNEMHYSEVGANTTLLIQVLASRGIIPSEADATLLLLGIYEDTGSLRFSSTTPQDLEAAAWLLKHGASLDIADRFLGIKLTQAQKSLMTNLSLNGQIVEVRGIPIYFTQASVTEFVDEIAFLVKKVQETENTDVIFGLVQTGNRVFIVGRSRLPVVDVGNILSKFGGGGHPQAASCLLIDCNRSIALQRLLDAIREEVSPGIVARDIMSSPVRTIDAGSKIEDGHIIIAHTGYSGLVVVDDENHVTGVITRSSMDKALQHGLGHAPVKGYMVRDPVTINEETSIDEIQKIIIEQRIGFLPVVFAGKLSGVVTRPDVLTALHRRRTPSMSGYRPIKNGSPRDYGTNLVAKLPAKFIELLSSAGNLADRLEVTCFLIGGIVRDLVLDVENIDIDLLIEGDGIAFAHEFAGKYNAQVIENTRFRTAKVVIENELVVDIATAREEFYTRPGALPEVAAANIRDDLIRRDFTINTLAIQLNSRSWGLFIDHFGGLQDIKNGYIRVLHTFSFVDDPTRILRALRFSERFGFALEPQTDELLRRALKEGRLDEVSHERIREEILLCLREKQPWRILRRIIEEGIPGVLYQSLYIPEILQFCDDPVRPVYDWIIEFLDIGERPLPEHCYAAVLFAESEHEHAVGFVTKYKFDQHFTALAESIPTLMEFRELIKAPGCKDSDLVFSLEKLPSACWVALAVIAGKNSPERDFLVRYLSGLRKIRPAIDGDDLIKAGFNPGPGFRTALEKIRREKIDGGVFTKDEEMAVARKVLEG